MQAPTQNLTRPAHVYVRRTPEQTLLYQTVARHLDSFSQSNAERGGVLPWFVKREFEGFLKCGILAHGFVRVYCRSCKLERLVAFSCKGRSLCPACGVRRMADGAAHLVDRVLPDVPVRQWVLSLPHAVRFAIAFDATLCGQVHGLFIRAVQRFYRHAAKAYVDLDSVQHAHPGAVTCIQRFSGALGLNVHFHSLFLDGVFVEQAGGNVMFCAVPAPSRKQLQAVTDEVCSKVQALLGGSDLDARGEPARRLAEDQPLLVACAAASVVGRIATGERAGARVQRLGEPPPLPETKTRRQVGRYGAETQGFNLHAGVRVPAHARRRLERLCCYILRPPISQERLASLGDGRVTYRLKRPWSDGTLAMAFTPQEFLEKLATLVPPPRAHQILYMGVLASHARLRCCVVPTPSDGDAAREEGDPPCHPGRPRQLDWAALLKRTYALDVLVCPRCGGSMRIIAAITQTKVIRAILRACGQPSAPPERTAAPRQVDLPGFDL